MRPLRVPSSALPAPALLLALALLPAPLSAAESNRCAEAVHDQLSRLPLAAGDLKSVRIIERTNIADFGPDIFGIDAWVRLRSCSGWLIINMRPTCYVVQTYTRGDCRIADVQYY